MSKSSKSICAEGPFIKHQKGRLITFEIFENRCGIRSFAGNVEEIWFEVSIGSENKKQFEMKEES